MTSRELPWIDSGNKIDVHYKALTKGQGT